MKKNAVLYLFPLAMDIIISLSLFAGRHSFAEKGMDTKTVGSIVMIYGIGYILCSVFMGKVVKPGISKRLMLGAITGVAIVLVMLANTEKILFVQILFAFLPFGTSLYFVSYQSFMLKVETSVKKPLRKIVGHYTFAWSVGFALGPVISIMFKGLFSWMAVYYSAACIMFVLGIIAFAFRPESFHVSDRKAEDAVCPDKEVPGISLCMQAWFGLLIGFPGWIMIATYWPVQSESLGFSTSVKGGVEFAFAMTQAVSGLVLAAWSWHYKPLLLPLFALGGMAGAVCFAFASAPFVFILGGMFYGIYSGSFFSYLVFHAMVDQAKAVKRVAINETLVGMSFLLGPVAANVVLGLFKNDFTWSYLMIALFITAGVSIQALWIFRTLSGYRAAGKTVMDA